MKQFFKVLFLVLPLFICSHLHAQLQGQALIDSLLKELPKQKEDTNKVKMLNSLSYGYHIINPDEGIKYGLQSLDLATRLGWEKGIGNSNYALGTNYYSKADNHKALEYDFKALKMDEETGDKNGIATVTGNIGNVYNSQSDYPKALEYNFKSLKMNEETGNKNGIAIATQSIGIVYGEQSDYTKALEYFQKSLKMYEELGNKNGIAGVTQSISAVYYYQSNYPKALENDLKALIMYEELGNKNGIASVTGNIGLVYQKQGDYAKALEYYFEDIKMGEESADKYIIANNLENIGNIYVEIVRDTATKMNSITSGTELSGNNTLPVRKAGQPTVLIPKGKAALLASAIDHLQRGLVISKEIKALYLIQDCYKDLAEAYKLKADYKKAMEYGDSAKVIKDSVFSEANGEKIAMLENKRKEYGDSLKAADAKRAVDVKAAHQRNYMYIGAVVIVLLLGFTFLLIRNNKLLGKEKKRSDSLLLNILPEEVASQLKDTGRSIARQFDDVTVLFTDFVNFTEAGERLNPQALIEELDACFKKFDEITGKYGIEKIKTIGDAYLAVAGLPTPDTKHAEHVVMAATEINNFMQDRLAKLGNRTFEVRIGIHSGSVVAGIVGIKKFAYDIWGDTVNTAARMEQSSEAGKINISETTYELVKDKFTCEYRGEIEAKGKGMLKMYYVV